MNEDATLVPTTRVLEKLNQTRQRNFNSKLDTKRQLWAATIAMQNWLGGINKERERAAIRMRKMGKKSAEKNQNSAAAAAADEKPETR